MMPAASSGCGSVCVLARAELDSDEEAELKDTTKLEFDEVRAYLESVAGLAGSAAESAEVLR